MVENAGEDKGWWAASDGGMWQLVNAYIYTKNYIYFKLYTYIYIYILLNGHWFCHSARSHNGDYTQSHFSYVNLFTSLSQ
jgi:hypothetical protein